MNSYIIMTDANTDLPPELAHELGIPVIPMDFTMNGTVYGNRPEGFGFPIEEFYKRLTAGESVITHQRNAAEFEEAFAPHLQNGSDVLYICFSSGLSGTYQSALLAANELAPRYPGRSVTVVDSRAASMGQGLLVYHAVMQKRAGKSREEVVRWLEENRNRLAHWFTVNDLNHLKRGGRVSGAAALFGTMLGIKPVLHVDDEGRLVPVEKVRGRRQSLEALADHMENSIVNPEEQVVFISHACAPGGAQYLEQQIYKRMAVRDVVTAPIGPVIGAHAGPGTVALFFLAKDKN